MDNEQRAKIDQQHADSALLNAIGGLLAIPELSAEFRTDTANAAAAIFKAAVEARLGIAADTDKTG